MSRLKNPIQWLRGSFREQPLSYRILVATIAYSFLIAFLATLLQLYLAYQRDIKQIADRLEQIETSHVPSLQASLWAVDEIQIGHQLDGILRLPDIAYARLQTSHGPEFERGTAGTAGITMTRDYALIHQTDDGAYPLGTLEVSASNEGIFARLRRDALSIAVKEAIAIFLIAIFVLLLFQFWINRHLRSMARYAHRMTPSQLDQPLELSRKSRGDLPDELDQVVDALNQMRESLAQHLHARARAESELQVHRDHLEELVVERTAELEGAKRAAEEALEKLQLAQERLVETEKMASLGQLVAGVAHEVNTPLGVALTATSYLHDSVCRARQAMTARGDPVPESEFLQTVEKSSHLIEQSLQRAARLIQSFKQVSVDRSSDDRRQFMLHTMLNELTDNLSPMWKHRAVEVQIDCVEGVEIEGFPGALGQVITNLIQNSLMHAFEENEAGRIDVEVAEIDPDHIEIRYRDSGGGVDEETRKKMFEPFYTTKRNLGGTGLGLHVVYNLVVQKMRGSLREISRSGQGCVFLIRIPRRAGPAEK